MSLPEAKDVSLPLQTEQQPQPPAQAAVMGPSPTAATTPYNMLYNPFGMYPLIWLPTPFGQGWKMQYFPMNVQNNHNTMQ